MSSAAKEEVKSSSSPAAAKQQINASTAAAPVVDTQKSGGGGGGGGLFDYLISRKKIHNHNHTPPSPSSPNNNNSMKRSQSEERMKYHRLANAAGSQYFGSLSIPLFNDDSDSDNDDNQHESSNKQVAATFSAAASSSSSAPLLTENQSSSSWLAKFQKKSQHENDNIDELKSEAITIERSSSSWMNKAWQTVDSATDWISSPSLKLPSNSADNNSNSSSSQPSTSSSYSWWTVPTISTISNTISSINLPNPFKDDNESSINDINHSSINNNNNSTLNNHNNNNSNNANLLLPKIASRFEWATKRRNPYQAVIGRVDTDYYLLSGPVMSLWGLSWIPTWFRLSGGGGNDGSVDNGGRRRRALENGGEGGGGATGGMMNGGEGMVMRRKSLPSEASVMAVKNLLALVQQQQQYDDDDDDGGGGEEDDDDDDQQHQKGPSLPQPRQNTTPLLSPVPSPPPQKSFTPRSPSIQPFPDLPQESSSFDSDHSPIINHHYPSPRMTPVQSFQASPKHDGVKPVPSPLTLPKSSSSPILRHRSSSFQDSTHPIIHTSGKTTNTLNGSNSNKNNQAADAEMAARLAEGTLRAYRDLALDEATELHSALHHWTLRWERPFLGWLEAGPTVWFSEKGYSPYSAGKKVSQIQAVLARRCAVIGEIQQHLWRANWQRGVAEWGMLGHGQGEWASVMLEHGDMTDAPGPSPQNQTGKKKRISMKIFNHSSFVGGNVSNSRGGQILVDEEALTRWSIDGIKVVRDQLYRAGIAGAQLPYYENWPNEVRHFNGDIVGPSNVEIDHPTWAKRGVKASSHDTTSSIVINNLPGMADEVSSLLQSIELNLDQQRQRRLNKLRPQSNLRRNWYMFALGIPTAAYATYHVCKDHGGYFLLKEVLAKINEFCKEHISEPCFSIYQELFTRTGRIDVNDRKARIDTIESLKRMIRSWLDETFADMPEAEKIAMSNNMDISLIEELKEESIKHIYEINSVVRCSLIEMQFIKKELLNALVAMDELMGSNEINARLAAMTPAVILVIGIRKVFRFIFYALFKFGAPKQEIYASFRKTILDIERLLLMRDDPPPNPPSLSWGSTRHARSGSVEADDVENNQHSRQTLSAADLGMLLLHIHECRSILWESRRRFNNDVLRNVSEDLAEIAGERGPVSVRQQLQILSRMSRTYKFMKVDYSSMIG